MPFVVPLVVPLVVPFVVPVVVPFVVLFMLLEATDTKLAQVSLVVLVECTTTDLSPK